ncbi:MAG: oligoendopeptidase F [Myxococcales bacterium]|nr:oligoendopeptidase F [Myxococcales bacterium]
MSKLLFPVSALVLFGCSAHAHLAPSTTSTNTTASVASQSFVPDANMDRALLPADSKWNLAPLLADDAAFAAASAQVEANIAALAACQGKLGSPDELTRCLALYFDTRLIANKMTLYAQTRLVTDQKSPDLNAMNDEALKRFADFMTATAFIRGEILAWDKAQLDAAIALNPNLATYAPYLHGILRRKASVRSPETERVLALAGDNLWAEIDLNELPSGYEKTFDALLSDIQWPTITDAQDKQVQLTLSNYAVYRASPDRRVREETVDKFFGTLRKFQDSFAATLGGQIGLNVFFARARGYDTALDAYLDKDDIDTAVYRSLVSAINANLAPLHRYVSLRKKVMGLDQLHFYDLYTPMIDSAQVTYPYDAARSILPKALAPLGEEYVRILEDSLDPKQGWIDLYPHKDKQSGAFSCSVYGVHPFVKMNYFNDHDGLSTLAHELGHALHSDLAMKAQPYVTASYSMLNAETASTFNEKLLSTYLLQQAKTKDEELSILNKLAETIRGTIYRQAMFAEFELKAHELVESGKPVTAQGLNEIYGNLVQAYYGPDFTMGPDDAVEWAYIPHFYYKYYVYSYALGLSAGIALAEKVATGDVAARDAYLGMLKAGSSKPPVELLKDAGVDLTTPEAVVAAAKLLDATVARMEEIISGK